MCGITGILNFKGKPVSQETLKEMTDVMIHRGPDDSGFYFAQNVGLGHRRLSIIDLSSAGHQPMSNEDKNIWITYNGEIYNYLEIRKNLEKRGHQFKSNTDTEVIVHAYEEWGTECLKKFNGMWAFALWDNKKKELFCARDRFGIKPFYYFFDNQIFAFASEIKSLLKLGIKREPNDVLIYDFLKFGILDHTNETFFKDIKKLPAASFMKINQNGEIITKKYWDFKISDKINDETKNNQKYIEEFLELFINSVRLRLRSDVPIGSCLSGGLDSSAIVCVINELLKKEGVKQIGEYQKTFSSCFDDPQFDERKYIEEVARKTKVEKNYIFPSAENFINELDKLIWHQEEPFRSTSIYAQYKVFERAKQRKIIVLLDGQGADELLGGYRKFYIFYLRKLLQEHRYFLFFNEFIKFFSSVEILKTLNIKNGLKYFKFGNKLLGVENLLTTQFFKKFQERKLNFGYQKNLGERIKEDVTLWSLPALLRYEDKNSMAHSIETRLPFLDHRLVEKISLMPIEYKLKNGWTKKILRDSMKGILPEKIRLRKSKLGFVTPERLWIKNTLNKEIRETIKNSIFIPQYINIDKIENRLIDENLLFRFYILEKWAQKFLINRL